jgi:DNA ligase-1
VCGLDLHASTPIRELAALSEELARTGSRITRMRLLGDFLRALPAGDRCAAARLLVGRALPAGDPRSLEVRGTLVWQAAAAVAGQPPAASPWAGAVDFGQAVARLFQAAGRSSGQPPLTVGEVSGAFAALAAQAGTGARKAREEILLRLLGRASPGEAGFLAKVILRDMRHGANEGMLLEALARAVGAAPEAVRQAAMLLGDVGEVVRLAFDGGEPAIRSLAPRMFSPITPMLAQTATTLDRLWEAEAGRIAMEYKLDGARIQIHAEAGRIRLFSRRLHDVTASLPDIGAALQAGLAGRRAILEGEVIAVDASGRPRPFQQLLQRYRRVHEVEDLLRDVPVRLFLFDLLLDGEEALLARPYAERWARLQGHHRGLGLVPRLVPAALEEARSFYRSALAAGHEGVMLKRLDSPYVPGVRGGHWLKLKRVRSLDLVIVAADYGYGRRHGWLSNYHLAARDRTTGEFRPVGKTFKGLTDEQFREMTASLLALRRGQRGGTVFVEPRIVVEVTYSDLQRSRLYPDGMALRFARISRLRTDKAAAEVDSIQTMRALFEQQWEEAAVPGPGAAVPPGHAETREGEEPGSGASGPGGAEAAEEEG